MTRDTKRFDESVPTDELIEGDRINKFLVARHPDMIGSPLHRTPPDVEDNPDAQLVIVTGVERHRDRWTALLLDPEMETFVRASRLNSQQAMRQSESDWTVKDVGERVVVDTVHEIERPSVEEDQPADEYAQEWVEVLFDEIRYTGGDDSFRDERRVDGRTLELNDYDGRKLLADVSLE